MAEENKSLEPSRSDYEKFLKSEQDRKASSQDAAVKARRAGDPAPYGQSLQPLITSPDPKIAAGQMIGADRAATVYGMTYPEIGTNVRDIVSRRRSRLGEDGPEDTAMRQDRNRQLRTMRAGGASEGQMAQLERNYAMDISREGYRRESEDLSEYQKLIGNILGGTTSLEMGFAGLEKSGEQVATPTYNRGLTVICTELYNQGYLSEKIIAKDAEYGNTVRCTRNHVYIGYRFLADPIVKLMKKSSLFTWLVSIFAVAWARNMAGYESKLGKAISKVGEPICGFVGKLIYFKESRYGQKA